MNKQVDITTYPEGWNEVLKMLTFLPDDEARSEFLATMALFLAQM
jgi:hypothetical protein